MSRVADSESPDRITSNGAALGAFLAAGVGSFALGVIVILNEADVLTMPGLYGPAGGISGRTTAAVAIWLLSWAVLHRRWNGREIGTRRVKAATLILTGLGVLLSFPPVWSLF
jgi:hypothetical protein